VREKALEISEKFLTPLLLSTSRFKNSSLLVIVTILFAFLTE